MTDKTIEGIRFKWYVENVFGDPVDIGGIEKGFGRGYTDDSLKPKEKQSGSFDLPNSDAKKLKFVWPIEIVFSDGTKWKSSH